MNEDENYLPATCRRCGYEWSQSRRQYSPDRADKKDLTLCQSCRTPPLTMVRQGKNDFCTPWQGDFDLDTMQPIDHRGRVVQPGVRTCGHSDCMRKAHIIPAAVQASHPTLTH